MIAVYLDSWASLKKSNCFVVFFEKTFQFVGIISPKFFVLSHRPSGDPQMIRFGAHLVLVLRYLLAEEMKDTFKDKILSVGDNILHL